MSTRTISFTHQVEGVLTDVTSAALSDPTATFGVKRDDTGAVVVADGTAMTHQSTGVYTYSFTDPGVAMTAYIEYVYRGTTYRFEDDLATSADGDWYYADQQDVIDLIGETALRLISNEPNAASDAAIDSERVQRMGELCDALMDAELTRLGYDTPLTNMSAGTTKILANVNAGLVVRELNRPRALMDALPKKNLQEMDRRILRAIADAEHTWKRILLKQVRIVADKSFETTSPAQVYVPTASDNTYSGNVVVW